VWTDLTKIIPQAKATMSLWLSPAFSQRNALEPLELAHRLLDAYFSFI
jgi:hypothetical protein